MAMTIGLSDLHYALLTKDDVTGVTYSAPVKIAGAVNAKISPKSSTENFYSDDIISETASIMSNVDVELEMKDFPEEVQEVIFGHTFENGVLKKGDDIAPYLALGFRSKKSNGSYKYVWLTKGKFELPEMEHATATDKPKFNSQKVKGTFIKRENDKVWQLVGDEDNVGFTAASTWFTEVYKDPTP